jgi:hypothetical protein
MQASPWTIVDAGAVPANSGNLECPHFAGQISY